MNSENGHRLEQQFNEIGFRVKFVKEVKSPQTITFYFRVVNALDFSKKRVESLLEKLSIYNHVKFKYVETDLKESDFGMVCIAPQRQTLWLGNLTFSANYITDKFLVPIGKDNNNNQVDLDFNKLSHLLVAGTTGSGKSVFINTLITSLLITTPIECFDMVLIDPKQVDLDRFKTLPNVKHISSTDEAVYYFSKLVDIMEERYKLLQEKGLKNGNGVLKPLFVIVDELADLMLSARYEIEEQIVRLAQKGRACGIHLVLGTQSPRATVITGLIRANIPNTIALKTASIRESVILLGHKSCEELLGYGDSIIKLQDSPNEIRTQIAYVNDEQITEYVKYRGGE